MPPHKVLVKHTYQFVCDENFLWKYLNTFYETIKTCLTWKIKDENNVLYEQNLKKSIQSFL